MGKKIFLYFITVIFILLFMYTGVDKLRNSEALSIQIKEIPFLKPFASWLLALVACIELAVVILLTRKSSRLAGLYACLILMLSFTLYLILISYFSEGVTCSCGGILTQLPQKLHIIFNICLVGVASAGVYLEKQVKHFEQRKQSEKIGYT